MPRISFNHATNISAFRSVSDGDFITSPSFNCVLCTMNESEQEYKDPLSSFQNDRFCWNQS